MLSDAVLSVAGLTKSFRRTLAVDNVDFSIGRGEIVGFLGPNGAGKTTVMSMVMGLLKPDSGRIELLGVQDGHKRKDVRLRIGYLQEKPRIYPEMTARAYLGLFAKLYGIANAARRADAALERVGLTAAADRRLDTYSRGMQQRACLARVMLHEPEFLILDEPTLGLDPGGVADMRRIFRDMQAGGTTLLFSSHQLAEMERICDKVVFMRAGKVIASGQLADLLPSLETDAVLTVETYEPVAEKMEAIRSLPGVAEVRAAGINRIEIVRSEDNGEDLRESRARIARGLSAMGLTVLGVAAETPSLERLFLGLAGDDPARPSKTTS